MEACARNASNGGMRDRERRTLELIGHRVPVTNKAAEK